jgi:uncharacterized protein YjdB
MRHYTMLFGLALLACSEQAVVSPEPPLPPPPSSSVLSLSAPFDSIRVGSDLQLTAVLRSTIGDVLPTPILEWTVDAPAVATISSTGLLRGISPGRVHVTAATGAIGAALAVEVLSLDPAVVVLGAGPDTVRPGGTLAMTARVFAPGDYPLDHAWVTWTSSRPDVATISAAGVLTGAAFGTTVITAQSGSVVALRSITVLPSAPGSILVSGLDHTLHIGDQAQLQAQLRSTTGMPMDPGVIQWSSGQPSVATVSAQGKVLAIGAGEATISAQAGTVSAQVTAVVLPTVGAPLPSVGLIAFYRVVGRDTAIEVRTGDGALILSSGVHPGRAAGDTPTLSISPTGTSVAFDCAVGICDLAIPSGAITPRPAVCCSAGQFSHPAWLADGKEMIVQRDYSSIAWLDAVTGGLVTRRGPFYTAAPHPSADGSNVLYQCDWWKQYDDPTELCRMDINGQVTLYRYGSFAPSWSLDGTLAYTRAVSSATGIDRNLVIEPLQLNVDPAGPGVQEYPGFSDVTETAWGPGGFSLALVRSGQLWIVSMPGATQPMEFAHMAGTTVFGVSWR